VPRFALVHTFFCHRFQLGESFISEKSAEVINSEFLNDHEISLTYGCEQGLNVFQMGDSFEALYNQGVLLLGNQQLGRALSCFKIAAEKKDGTNKCSTITLSCWPEYVLAMQIILESAIVWV